MKKLSFKDWINTFKATFSRFGDDRGVKLSASLAYYTIFSLPPILVIVIGISSFFYGQATVQKEIFQQINDFVGADAAKQVHEFLIKNATHHNNVWAAIVGAIALMVGASSAFVEIQDSINLIWRLKPKPKKGFLKMVFNRLLSFSMILVLGFLLLVSLVLNAILGGFLNKLKSFLPDNFVNLLFPLDYVLIFIVIALLFAAIFKVLPDARIKLRDVMIGSVVTACLFMIGKFLIGYYLKYFGNVSAYGTAGSVLIILLWVYYNSIILYIGAEFTQVYINTKGSKIEPYNYAILEEERPMQKTE